VAEAVASGDLTVNRARPLARLRNERTADLFDRDEELLIKQAKELTVDETAKLARYWQINADSDGPEPDDDKQSARFSPSYDGHWKLDANLNPEGGMIFGSALDQIMQDLYRAETAGGEPARSAAQRRADALIEMARRATAARADQPAARPLVIVKTDLEAVESRAGRPAETDNGTPVSPQTLQRLLCDANVCRVVINGESVVLDVGRDSRTATAAQRRALLVRDGGCAFPGCDRPPGWCEAHHIVWWEHDGTTDLLNLCLLCSHHHHAIHKGRFSVSREPEGGLTFTRADGTIVR
jgi:hypothetical protein